MKGVLLEDIDDPSTGFRGFWRYEPGVLDALRRTDDLERYHTLGMPEPMRSEARRTYEVQITARRAWLKVQGYR